MTLPSFFRHIPQLIRVVVLGVMNSATKQEKSTDARAFKHSKSRTPSQHQHVPKMAASQGQEKAAQRECGGTTCTNSNGALKEKLAPESARRNIKRYNFSKKFFGRCHNVNETDKKISDKFSCWSNLQNSFACQSGHKGNHENSNDNAERKEVEAALARAHAPPRVSEAADAPKDGHHK